MKYILPRKLYYMDLLAGSGWIGIANNHIIVSGYDFWYTLIYTIKW